MDINYVRKTSLKVKILFVCSGNSGGAGVIVSRQADSLLKNGHEVSFFLIKGKGFRGYLKNIKPLKNHLKTNNYDVIHAHYSLSAFAASIAGAKKMVVSLMGSDVKSNYFFLILIKLFFNYFSWKKIIVKSEDMHKTLNIKRAVIIPNGVDTSMFYEMDRLTCRAQLGWDSKKKHLLFGANPTRPEKNFTLLNNILNKLDSNTELHVLNHVPHKEIPLWLNASDIVILTSLWEGSPNIIKEAMACNVKIISTRVGDVEKIMGKTEGCELIDFSEDDLFKSVLKLMHSEQRTKGREVIIRLGYDSEFIKEKLITCYKD